MARKNVITSHPVPYPVILLIVFYHDCDVHTMNLKDQ